MFGLFAQVTAESMAWLNNALALLVALGPLIGVISWINKKFQRVDQLETTVTAMSEQIKQQTQQIKLLEQNQANNAVIFAEIRGDMKVLASDLKNVIALLERIDKQGDR